MAVPVSPGINFANLVDKTTLPYLNFFTPLISTVIEHLIMREYFSGGVWRQFPPSKIVFCLFAVVLEFQQGASGVDLFSTHLTIDTQWVPFILWEFYCCCSFLWELLFVNFGHSLYCLTSFFKFCVLISLIVGKFHGLLSQVCSSAMSVASQLLSFCFGP